MNRLLMLGLSLLGEAFLFGLRDSKKLIPIYYMILIIVLIIDILVNNIFIHTFSTCLLLVDTFFRFIFYCLGK